MRNSITDLYNLLFEQAEYLGDKSLKGRRLKEEIERSKAMIAVGGQILATANVLLQARVAADNFIKPDIALPKIMED